MYLMSECFSIVVWFGKSNCECKDSVNRLAAVCQLSVRMGPLGEDVVLCTVKCTLNWAVLNSCFTFLFFTLYNAVFNWSLTDTGILKQIPTSILSHQKSKSVCVSFLQVVMIANLKAGISGLVPPAPLSPVKGEHWCWCQCHQHSFRLSVWQGKLRISGLFS